MPNSTPTQKTDNWTKFAMVQLYGSYFVGKLFAVIGGPLVALMLFHRDLARSLYKALTQRDLLSWVCWTVLLSIMYGICEAVYGLLSGYDPYKTFQILIFNFSPLYFFLGIWAGARKPGFLQAFIKFSMWFSTFYTLIYFLVLRNLGGDDVVGHPGSGLITFMAPFCFEFSLALYAFPILIAAFNLIAAQIRADWVGLSVALVIWGVATKKMNRVLSIAGILVALLMIGFVFDVRIPGFKERGGEISARDTVGRMLSSFNPELAREYNTGAAAYAGNVDWREKWWQEIWDTVTKSPSTIMFGMGYGYPIGDLVSYLKGIPDIRTPHSIFFFTLCYSGFVGVALFFSFQAGILLLHWRTFRATGQTYGFVSHTAILVSAFFGNVFEAPQNAIPLYLIFGMAIGPLFTLRYAAPENASARVAEPATQSRRIRMRGYAVVPNPASE